MARDIPSTRVKVPQARPMTPTDAAANFRHPNRMRDARLNDGLNLRRLRLPTITNHASQKDEAIAS